MTGGGVSFETPLEDPSPGNWTGASVENVIDQTATYGYGLDPGDLTRYLKGSTPFNLTIEFLSYPWRGSHYESSAYATKLQFLSGSITYQYIEAVPEPATCAAMGAGLFAVMKRRRKSIGHRK